MPTATDGRFTQVAVCDVVGTIMTHFLLSPIYLNGNDMIFFFYFSHTNLLCFIVESELTPSLLSEGKVRIITSPNRQSQRTESDTTSQPISAQLVHMETDLTEGTLRSIILALLCTSFLCTGLFNEPPQTSLLLESRGADLHRTTSSPEGTLRSTVGSFVKYVQTSSPPARWEKLHGCWNKGFHSALTQRTCVTPWQN